MIALVDPHQPITGSRRSSASAVERGLHAPEDRVVDLVEVGARAELLAQVDRVEHLDRDLRGQREVAEHVADVQAPRDRERDRQHLQPEQPVEAEEPREPLAAREEERGLLAADRDDRDDRHVLSKREPDPALAAVEVDLRRVPRRAVDLVVAAGVDEQRGARVERLLGVLRRGRDGAVLAQACRGPASRARGCGRAGRSAARRRSRCVNASVKTWVSGVRLPPEWLPTSSTGPLGRDPVEPAHVGAEVEAREHPQARKRLADVVGVALVEVGLRDARLGRVEVTACASARAELDRARQPPFCAACGSPPLGDAPFAVCSCALCALPRPSLSREACPGPESLRRARLSGARSRAARRAARACAARPAGRSRSSSRTPGSRSWRADGLDRGLRSRGCGCAWPSGWRP